MSTKLEKVAERARKDPSAQFHSLAHVLDEDVLREAFDRIRKDAAVGVDGVTKERYGEALEENLRDLHARLKSKTYRHQAIRRVHIPKAPGKTRPIGISCIEDKIVQGGLQRVMEAVFEPVFRDCSYGFRPGRSAHDALRAVDEMVMRQGMTIILEGDIASFFDSMVPALLREMIRERISDGSIIRLVGKCLRVGVLDGEEFSKPDRGTAQGSIISPLFGNVYLHHVLDVWFEDEVVPRLRGYARLVRYADDFVIGFTRKDDAEKVKAMLGRRLAEFGLTMQPDKTRLVPFERPPRDQQGGRGPATWDFLGFTLYWRKSRSGRWVVGTKTRKARIQRAAKAISEFCRRHRHDPLEDQHAALVRRLAGHYNYFGVNGNYASLHRVRQMAERAWFKWLRRRSQRGRRRTWDWFKRYLRAFPLPRPRIRVQLWGTAP